MLFSTVPLTHNLNFTHHNFKPATHVQGRDSLLGGFTPLSLYQAATGFHLSTPAPTTPAYRTAAYRTETETSTHWWSTSWQL